MSYAREVVIVAAGSVSLPSSWRGKKCEQACAKWNSSLMSLWKVYSFVRGGMKDTQLIFFIESPSHPYANASAFRYLLQLLPRKAYLLHMVVPVCISILLGHKELCTAECIEVLQLPFWPITLKRPTKWMLLMRRPIVSKDTKWKTFTLQLLMGRSESDSSKLRLWLPWCIGGREIKWTELMRSMWIQADCFPFPSILQINAFSPMTRLGFGLFRVDLNRCYTFRITVWPRLRGCRAWWICVSCTSATMASKSSRDWRTMWAGSC